MDFRSPVSPMSSKQCDSGKVYTVVKDVVAQTTSLSLCAGEGGRAVVTMGNQVEIRVFPDSQQPFMLQIQGKDLCCEHDGIGYRYYGERGPHCCY